MEHLVEVHDLLYRIRRPGLLSVPERGIGDEDLFRGIGENKFVIEFHPANLFVRKDIAIEVWLLNIQEGKLLDGMSALKGPLFSGNGHIFSLILMNA
jgi:hypothetical protein